MKIRLIIPVMNTTQTVVNLKPEKNFRLNGIYAHDLCDTSAKFHQYTVFGYTTSPQTGQLPDGLIAQLVGDCTNIAEVMGSIPLRPEFFSGFKVVLNCDDQSYLHIIIRSSNINYFIFHFQSSAEWLNSV